MMGVTIQLAASLLVSYLVTTILYNLYFHPLARVPGPFLCRISSLPSFYYACKGNRHLWIRRNFQIYGTKFRAAPNVVLFNTPSAHTDIYGVRANTTRSSFYISWKRNEEDVHTINSTDPVVHAKKRKLLNLVFTEQSLRAFDPFIISHVDRWVELNTMPAENGDGRWSKEINMAHSIDYLLFDILGDLCFGESLNIKEPGENKLRKLPHLIARYIATGYKVSKSPLYELILYLRPRGLNKLLEKARQPIFKDYENFISTSVDKRIAAHKADPYDNARKDMIHFLLTAIDPDTKLPAFSNCGHLLGEARLLVLAGTDTTATTLAALFFYLAHNASVLEKLTREIRSTFASVHEITLGSKLGTCKYLRACIDEALRMAHPAPGDLPREVLPGGTRIDGEVYPAGTIVGCAEWAMGRDEARYADANTYRPERWIASSAEAGGSPSEEEVRGLKKAFHPFSSGPMNCAGQKLAILEMLIVCARTVFGAEMRLAPGLEGVGEGGEMEMGEDLRGVYVVKDHYLTERNGPVLQFRRRLD
ncbi:benzoate 4-monooxygenase cytochrome-like protein P450 [Corynespora cassiicola Philippines]|uniref:Benzoate 4-monooxygenase cytochrome-like protein P450 n=1 Tax=Corynespora cassiicola Philippines TaxID=1448308 RepID=A0A2T2N4P0_CORCC|nr:benzoate 4-monooxygenase cytochrome-like protein P450 [Corynespora cassiicola Philippines]